MDGSEWSMFLVLVILKVPVEGLTAHNSLCSQSLRTRFSVSGCLKVQHTQEFPCISQYSILVELLSLGAGGISSAVSAVDAQYIHASSIWLPNSAIRTALASGCFRGAQVACLGVPHTLRENKPNS